MFLFQYLSAFLQQIDAKLRLGYQQAGRDTSRKYDK
jgi:hypothetical protein